MHTTLDCLPCLLKQALATARRATDQSARHREIMTAAAALLPDFDLALSPPENATRMYRLIAQLSGVGDPFAGVKQTSTAQALRWREPLRKKIHAAADPLFAAIRFAIAGNVIDYGAHHDFDLERTLARCLEQKLAINDHDAFRRDLDAARTVLYLGDNCGELVFDGLLIEQLQKKVTLAVKEQPIINDALLVDAQESGLGQLCTLITNGTGCPGTPLATVSSKFRRCFAEADLVISKGQGNFETLSDCGRPVYFLLTVKCQVVAGHLADRTGSPVEVGAAIFLKHEGAAA